MTAAGHPAPVRSFERHERLLDRAGAEFSGGTDIAGPRRLGEAGQDPGTGAESVDAVLRADSS